MLLIYLSQIGSGRTVPHPKVILGKIFIKTARVPMFLYALLRICMVTPLMGVRIKRHEIAPSPYKSVLRLRGGGLPNDDADSDNEFLMDLDSFENDPQYKGTEQTTMAAPVNTFESVLRLRGGGPLVMGQLTERERKNRLTGHFLRTVPGTGTEILKF